MSKRRLTHQQSRRIAQGQRRHAERLDQGAGDDEALGPERGGLVIAHYGRQLDIEPDGDEGTLVRCRLRSNIEPLVTGDRAVWRRDLQHGSDDEPIGVVVAGLSRSSVLTRPDSHSGRPKPVAANIDRAVVVIAPRPEPYPNLIDRYLIAAEILGIQPLLLLNKTDLLGPADEQSLAVLLTRYRDIGYITLRVSTVRQEGLDTLRAALQGHVSILVGQSGVGKSSLIGTLLPDIDIRVGALSEGAQKGRHTTTTARLFHLSGGGDLIDSPGIREFGLAHFSRHEVETAFPEFRPWLGRCRFRDCHHRHEPGCALLEALAAGAISAERMASYRSVIDEAST